MKVFASKVGSGTIIILTLSLSAEEKKPCKMVYPADLDPGSVTMSLKSPYDEGIFKVKDFLLRVHCRSTFCCLFTHSFLCMDILRS